MKASHRVIFIVLLALLGLALAGVVLTGNWVKPPVPERVTTATPASESAVVDQQPLVTAQRLATLAVAPDEQDFARDALRVADNEVDLAFASALREATRHPAPLTPAVRSILARIKAIEPRLKAEQDDVARLKQLLAKAEDSRKDALDQQLQIAEAQSELDQDALDDAQQDLIRAGGDPRSTVQRLLDQHEAEQQHDSAGVALPAPSPGSKQTYEETQSRSVIAQFRAWSELNAKQKELASARDAAKSSATQLASKHDALEQEVKDEESKKAAVPPASSSSAGEAPAIHGSSTNAAALASLNQLRDDQKEMAGLDKRITDLQELADTYGKWSAFVTGRQREHLHALLQSAAWILAVALLMFLVDPVFDHFFARLSPEGKRLHTLRSVIGFVALLIGAGVILLIVFGPPSQLATVVALVGAGLTVALKDFIVGFFGWFVLMGRNGIRVGDWVEINGVGGEVLEVGLLHTILLETGNWSDAGHPTGRKVSFVNSFAIEGHYFNFSTAGQWLWDELQVLIPADADPYSIAEAIQKIVAAQTSADARLAEQEWQRVVPGHGERSFSAEPAMSVRPTNFGVNVIVRYITRAHDRHELRARLYREVVELLHRKQIPQAVSEAAVAKPSSGVG